MKKVIPALSLLLLLLIGSGQAMACNCEWEGPFLKSAPDKELIIAAKVLSYSSKAVFKERATPTSMVVEVLHVLKGKEARKQLVIWGDNGSLCRPFLQMFPVDGTFVLALNASIGLSADGFEQQGHYYIPGCGVNWLGLYGSYVYGQINSHSYQSAMWLDYLSFKINLMDREPEGKTDSLALSIIQKYFKRSDITMKGIFERKCRDRSVASYATKNQSSARRKNVQTSLSLMDQCASGKGYYIFWKEKDKVYMNLINDCIYSKKPIQLKRASRFFQYYEAHRLSLLQDRRVYTYAPEGQVCADVIHLYDGNSVYVNLLWDFTQNDRIINSDLVENWTATLYKDIQDFETMLEDPVFLKKMIRMNKIKITAQAKSKLKLK